MTHSQISYFATKSDLAESLQRVETSRPVAYVLEGSFEDSRPRVCFSYLDIPNLGASEKGQGILQPSYVVCSRGAVVTPLEVSQRRGGTRFVFDPQAVESGGLVLRLSGVHESGMLVPGLIGNTSPELYRLFREFFLEGYEVIKSFRVGPQAARRLDQGVPLTPNVKADPVMHLKR